MTDNEKVGLNIPPKVYSKVGRNLHNTPNHPINIIKKLIYGYFGNDFEKFDDLDPHVSTVNNFDRLMIPTDHPARSLSDTYYIDKETVLRTHTSAHQNELLAQGQTKFLVTGDVYRKDEIDSCHYPVFHQMEGLCLVEDGDEPYDELKKILVGLVETLFPGCEYRLNDDYFPFTHPSFEVEVMYGGKWLEILGCGVVQPHILESNGIEGRQAWAFGLGLERLAMILFEIPDIRMFWTTDDKFLSQFTDGEVTKFVPYSILDPITKDISFWIPEEATEKREEGSDWVLENDFFEICREACDSISNISLLDSFYHPKKGSLSHCYRITYQPVDTKMKDAGTFNQMVNTIQNSIREQVVEILNLELR